MVICMLLASILFLAFVYLFLSADNQIVMALMVSCKENQEEIIKNGQIELKLLAEHMQRTQTLDDKKKLKKGKKLKKQIDEAKKQLELLENKKLNVLDLLPVAGYRLIQILGWDYTNDIVKSLNNKCVQFKEKKEAMNYTYYILGTLLGNMVLGGVTFFALLGVTLGMNMGTRSLVVAVAGLAFFALMGYLPYDNVNVKVQKRREEIERQFPQVVSKMALLTVAGMEVNQAWKLTGKSGSGTLYEEMSRVLIDFENNVSPTEAYSKFIVRCNNRYTTKLATAIIQNLSKGNSEIVKLFRTLNDESWMEHKHNARRMGEAIQSKLMVPTMLMFGGIIILVIVPVMSGFGI